MIVGSVKVENVGEKLNSLGEGSSQDLEKLLTEEETSREHRPSSTHNLKRRTKLSLFGRNPCCEDFCHAREVCCCRSWLINHAIDVSSSLTRTSPSPLWLVMFYENMLSTSFSSNNLQTPLSHSCNIVLDPSRSLSSSFLPLNHSLFTPPPTLKIV